MGEGVNLLKHLRKHMFDVCSQVTCYAETSGKDAKDIRLFQGTLVRLCSLLHCSAILLVSELEDQDIEVLDLEGFDKVVLTQLVKKPPLQRVEVLFQWVQRLILEGVKSTIIPTPPPIVTRTFQELNSFMATLNDMESLSRTQFPFPFAQITSLLLLIHTALTPVLLGTMKAHWTWQSFFAFIKTFALWNLNLIAQEIENPFGGNANDLDGAVAQRHLNRSLMHLLTAHVQSKPIISQLLPKGEVPCSECTRLRHFACPDGEPPRHLSMAMNGLEVPNAEAGLGHRSPPENPLLSCLPKSPSRSVLQDAACVPSPTRFGST